MITEVKGIFRNKNLFDMSLDLMNEELFSKMYRLGVEVEENYLYINGILITAYEINLTDKEYHLCICCYIQYLLLRDSEKELCKLEECLKSAESKISLTNEINKNMANKIEAVENKTSEIVRLRRSKFISLK